MANRLTVVAGGLANAYLASAKGLPAEVGPASRLPTPAQLRDALDSLGLTYECGEWHDGWWLIQPIPTVMTVRSGTSRS